MSQPCEDLPATPTADEVVRDTLDSVADELVEGPEGRALVDARPCHLSDFCWAGRKAAEVLWGYEWRPAGTTKPLRMDLI